MSEPGSTSRVGRLRPILPGLLVAAVIAALATVIGRVVPLVGSAMPAVVIGVVLALTVVQRSSVRHAQLTPGLKFASKPVLQSAVVLLGAQLSLGQVVDVGWESLPIMLTTLVVCLLAALGIGTLLGVVGDLRTLIGVGTAICGASAIAAVAPVIGASSAAIAYAVSTIFVFNLAAVLVFPPLGHLLGMSEHTFGLFAGTAVNDTSSVVATAGIYGGAALSFAVVVKLVRTLMIIPISVGLAIEVGRRKRAEDGVATPMTWRRAVGLVPWFLVGFLFASLARTVGLIPDGLLAPVQQVSLFLIATALAAIGLSTDLAGFRKAGIKPLLLGGLLWIAVGLTSVITLKLTGTF